MVGGRMATLLAGAVLSSAVPLLAQDLQAGDRVRVTAPDVLTDPQVGRLLWTDADSLVLANDGSPPQRWVIPPGLIARLEASQGRRGHARQGLLIGAAVGLVAGLVVIAQEGACTAAQDSSTGFCAYYATGTTLGGALLGLGIGAIVRTERWMSIPVG